MLSAALRGLGTPLTPSLQPRRVSLDASEPSWADHVIATLRLSMASPASFPAVVPAPEDALSGTVVEHVRVAALGAAVNDSATERSLTPEPAILNGSAERDPRESPPAWRDGLPEASPPAWRDGLPDASPPPQPAEEETAAVVAAVVVPSAVAAPPLAAPQVTPIDAWSSRLASAEEALLTASLAASERITLAESALAAAAADAALRVAASVPGPSRTSAAALAERVAAAGTIVGATAAGAAEKLRNADAALAAARAVRMAAVDGASAARKTSSTTLPDSPALPSAECAADDDTVHRSQLALGSQHAEVVVLAQCRDSSATENEALISLTASRVAAATAAAEADALAREATARAAAAIQEANTKTREASARIAEATVEAEEAMSAATARIAAAVLEADERATAAEREAAERIQRAMERARDAEEAALRAMEVSTRRVSVPVLSVTFDDDLTIDGHPHEGGQLGADLSAAAQSDPSTVMHSGLSTALHSDLCAAVLTDVLDPAASDIANLQEVAKSHVPKRPAGPKPAHIKSLNPAPVAAPPAEEAAEAMVANVPAESHGSAHAPHHDFLHSHTGHGGSPAHKVSASAPRHDDVHAHVVHQTSSALLAATGKAPPTASDSDVRTVLLGLLKGVVLVKHGRAGWPKPRMFWLDVTRQELGLRWGPAGKGTRNESAPFLSLGDVTGVSRGQATAVLKRASAAQAHCHFSILARERTLDFEAINADMAELWHLSLSRIIGEPHLLQNLLVDIVRSGDFAVPS